MAPIRKRVSLSVDTKIRILAEVDRKIKSKSEIAKDYNLSSSSLSTILKNREKIEKLDKNGNSTKRMRSRDAKWPALEEALIQWIKKMRTKNIPVDGKLLRSKADDFVLQMNIEGFKMSDGWLSRFKDRHKLSFRKLCGESASVNKSDCEGWIQEHLKTLLEKYSPDDVYNADETGLMFKLLPDRSLVFQSETSAGGKRAKARLSILLAANMSGADKLPLLVIGKAKNPRCFKGIRTLPVCYKNNTKAWMTSEIFESWIKEIDRLMLLKKRKIVVIVDNCSAHTNVTDLRAVELVFLPPNVTCVLQPMDQGVIQCFKKNYRRMLLNRIVTCLESDKEYNITVLSALHLIKASWDSVTAQTISNCFRHAGFVVTRTSEAAPDGETGTSEAAPETKRKADQSLIDKLREKRCIPDNLTFEDYASVDNEIQCVEEETDEAIVKNAMKAAGLSKTTEEESSDEDEIQVIKPRPTIFQAVDAVQILREFFEVRENSQKFLDSIMDMENAVYLTEKPKQTLITDFLNGNA